MGRERGQFKPGGGAKLTSAMAVFGKPSAIRLF